MSGDLVFRLLLGHLVGDYLLQPNWMALHKKERFSVAVLHCLVWTGVVATALLPELAALSLVKAAAVCGLILASHLVLDATNLVDRWLDLIGSRSYRRAQAYCDQADPQIAQPEIYKQFMVSYTAIVQTVADNTIHLALLYLITRLWIVGST